LHCTKLPGSTCTTRAASCTTCGDTLWLQMDSPASLSRSKMCCSQSLESNSAIQYSCRAGQQGDCFAVFFVLSLSCSDISRYAAKCTANFTEAPHGTHVRNSSRVRSCCHSAAVRTAVVMDCCMRHLQVHGCRMLGLQLSRWRAGFAPQDTRTEKKSAQSSVCPLFVLRRALTWLLRGLAELAKVWAGRQCRCACMRAACGPR
jgi:hypothetical protein